MPKQVAVILLNWNTPAHTASCISSVVQFCDASLYDLIIADNGSTDNSLSILQDKFPHHIYINNKENLGFAGGNNRALQFSITKNYNYSILLNNDTEVDEDFITPMLQYLENKKEVAALQPAIYYLHQKDKLWNGGSFFNTVTGETYSKNQKSRQTLINPEKVDWLTGCCFMVRNDALKKTGLLNEKFFLYYEDVELSFRLKASVGELHYFPATKIYHEAGVSGQQTKNKEGTLSPIIHYYLCRNKIWFLRRYSNPFFAVLIFLKNAIYYTCLLGYFIVRRRFKKAKYLYLGIKEGLFTPKSIIWP